MKIQINPKDFLPKLRLAASVTANLDTLPIRQNVKMTTDKKSGAILQATDGEMAIRLEVGSRIMAKGETLLPPKRLVQILDLTDEATLTLESVDAGLSVTGEIEDYILNTMPPNEFPDVDEFSATAYHEIPALALKEMIRRTIFATNAENQTFALGGVCFSMDGDDVSVVATDGVRLAWQQGSGNSVGDHKVEKAIVSVKTLQVLDRILGDKSIDADTDVQIAVDVQYNNKGETFGTALFHCNGITLKTSLIQGRFPKWREIIPMADKNDAPAKITCGTLLPAVLKAQVATHDDYPGVEFAFTERRLTLQGQGRETGIAKIAVPVSFKGEPIKTTLSAKFMTGFLRVLPPDAKLSFFVPPDNEPVKITADDGDYTYVIMPMQPD